MKVRVTYYLDSHSRATRHASGESVETVAEEVERTLNGSVVWVRHGEGRMTLIPRTRVIAVAVEEVPE